MAEQSPDFPVREPLVDEKRLVTDRWRVWLRNLHQQSNQSAVRLTTVNLTTPQSASISATPFDLGSLAGGLYRVSTFFQILTVGTISSSLQVAVNFTSNGVACQFVGTARTTNTTNTVDTNTWLLSVDPATPITYATTYASNAAASMRYQLNLVVEAVSV